MIRDDDAKKFTRMVRDEDPDVLLSDGNTVRQVRQHPDGDDETCHFYFESSQQINRQKEVLEQGAGRR